MPEPASIAFEIVRSSFHIEAMNDAKNASLTVKAAIVGGGPAGLAAAIALAQSGMPTALIARRAGYADNRTTALLGASIDLLTTLDVWPRCASSSAALRVMRLVDDTGRLIRAPEVKFSSAELGMDAFGHNIANRDLMDALESRASELSNLLRVDGDAASVEPKDASVAIRASSGETISAELAVGADGRHSLCREAAGIAVSRRPLDQSALTLNISHTRPHNDCSTEFHTARGPCVFVPLPGDNSSVVWVSSPAEIARLAALDDVALGREVERQSHSILGRIDVAPGRHVFPLSIEKPARLALRRLALVGEAAHVLPPIGAQGLNMGLRDGADIAGIVADAHSAGEDVGSESVLQRYERSRSADVISRTLAIDIANRTLLSDFLPVQSLRAAGMHLMNVSGALRRLAMREGLAPSWRKA